ncbi:MAG: TonB-dependent receptor, partial [Pseudomonadota bacterium]
VLARGWLLGFCGVGGAPGGAGSPPAPTSDVRSLITDIEQTRETAALFTHNDIELGGPLTLTLGARYTYENIEGSGAGRHIFEDGTIALNNRDDVGPAIGSNRIIENRLTGNVALRYALSETASAYVSYANGYKSGGFNGEVQNNATHFQDEGLFEAETVNAYEIGLKARPSDTLSFNAALFYQDYQDPQARIFVDFPQPDGSVITSNSLSNLDEAVSYGLEGDIAWSPVEGLDLAANLTLLETEIDQQGDVGGNAADFDGNPLPFASDVSIAAFARYERPVSDDVRMAIEANAKYQSEYYLDAEGLEERRDDGYTIVDASLKAYFDKPSLEVGVWGRNLLDEDYAVSGFGFIGYNTFIGAPRTYGVQVTLKR